MQDPETLAGGESPESQGSIRAEISNDIVALYKRFGGKGPTRCTTYMGSELVTVLLGEIFTTNEQTLIKDGKWEAVRHSRQVWQDTMEERFTEVVEQRTGRTVIGFMSNNHRDPDLAVEIFVMAPA